MPNPRDPVWNPAWVELKNPNITTVLGDTSGFEFDGCELQRARADEAGVTMALTALPRPRHPDDPRGAAASPTGSSGTAPTAGSTTASPRTTTPTRTSSSSASTGDGLDALLDARYHDELEAPLAPGVYSPGPRVTAPFPVHEIDVSDDGPYAVYNWELFFHAPVLIATHLSKNQRFAEAQRWFHYVFDPTSDEDDVPAPERFWKFLRFRQETAPEFIGELLRKLAEGTDNELAHPARDGHHGMAGPAVPAPRDRPGPGARLPAERGDEVPRQPHRLGRQPVPCRTPSRR